MTETSSFREQASAHPHEDASRQAPWGDRRSRWRYGLSLGILLTGGLLFQGFLTIVVLAVIDMFFLPPATQRLQDQFQMAGVAASNLETRTGATGFRRTEQGLFIRVQGETLPVDAFLQRFPDASQLVERIRAASDVCTVFARANQFARICVQWRRGGRAGGLVSRVNLRATNLAKYHPSVEWPEGNADLIHALIWSADAAIVDDWEVLVPTAPPPSDGLIRLETVLEARDSCTPPMPNGELPAGTYHSSTGFSFSTPCSRAGLDETAGTPPRPVVDVLMRKIAWDPEQVPQQFDNPADVFLEDESVPGGRTIRPLRVLRDPLTLAGRFYVVPDALIAEFDLADFRHGRTIVLTYASGRTMRRTIALNGVR